MTSANYHDMKGKRVVDEVNCTKFSTLSEEVKTAMRRENKKKSTICFICNVYFKDLTEDQEFGAGIDLGGKVGIHMI